MVVDLPRRWRWAIGGACALMLLLLLVFVGLARTDADAAPASIATPATARVVPAMPPAEESLVEAASPAPLAEPHAADEVRVCGGAWVRVQADGSVDPDELEQATRGPQQRERVRAALRASPNELARAAAVLLASSEPDELGAMPARSVEPLARAALTSTDPRVYGLAVRACNASSVRRTGASACDLVSAEQWARLDPDNAAPWRFVHAAAAARGDLAAQDDALFRVVSARRNESGLFDVATAVLDAAPDDDAALLAVSDLLTRGIGIESAGAISGIQSLHGACKGHALRDPNRAEICARLAEAMTERADSFVERTVGVAIGRTVGWPEQRTDRLSGETHAYMASMAVIGQPLREADQLACAPLRRELDRLRHVAALGEIGALRAWLAASTRPADAFIVEGRLRRQQAQASAPAASDAGG